MSSPLSQPFSLFPSRSSSPQQSHTCAYPPCPARFTHPSDLDFHQATHHSTMGYSPISALNRYPPDLTFPTPPTSIPASPLGRPTTTTANTNDSFPFPASAPARGEGVHDPLRRTTTTTIASSTLPPPLPTLETRDISSSSSSSSTTTDSSTTTTSPTLRHIKSLANFSLPFTHTHNHNHNHNHHASSSSSSSPISNRGGGMGMVWTPSRRSKGGKSGKTQTHKRNTACVMRCGRHGDEWLGLRGWRLWR